MTYMVFLALYTNKLSKYNVYIEANNVRKSILNTTGEAHLKLKHKYIYKHSHIKL